MSATRELLRELIQRPSVSPDDGGCQDVLCARLENLGFSIERLDFGAVQNTWARLGSSGPLLCFAGHTDVVPPGDAALWRSDPYAGEIRDGYLYGRGAADMKGSLAAMVTACERFLATGPALKGSLAFLFTSDEESIAVDGTKKVIDTLQARNEKITYCIVGEPSSSERLGDCIRNGRRGSLNGILTVHGTEGHVAYPDLADNPVHRFLPALTALCAEHWDAGNAHFPPTSFQISDIHAGAGTNNVIPGTMRVLFNFRFSSSVTAQDLMQRTRSIFDAHYRDYTLEWQLSGNPFITAEGILTGIVRDAIKAETGIDTQLSTSGGTSDGRFIAPTGAQVVELGPSNRTIHKTNECVSVTDLDTLSAIYQHIMQALLA